MAPMYCLYAQLPWSITARIAMFLKSQGEPVMAEPAHVTVLYGPEMETEIETVDPATLCSDVFKLSHTEIDALRGCVATVCGVSVFARPWKALWIVKLGLKCPELDAVRAQLVKRHPRVRACLSASEGLVHKHGIVDDDSFAPEGSTSWAHVTIATATTERAARMLTRAAKTAFADLTSMCITGIAAVTAETDTIVPL